MAKQTVYHLQAESLKALAHPLRIEVIDLLQKDELCFTEILEETGGLKSNLSQHLSILVNSGLLKVRRDSRCNYYSLSSAKVAKAITLVKEVLSENLQRQAKLLAST